jgi:hypothetical protein
MKGEALPGERGADSTRVIEQHCVSERQTGEMGPGMAAVIALMRIRMNIGHGIISKARTLSRQMVPGGIDRVLIPGRNRAGHQYRRNEQEV